MLSQILQDTKEHFEKTLEYLKKELSAIRTSRANPSLLEDLKVEAYGSFYSLKELATISVHSSNLLLISPFDPSVLYQIEKAIQTSSLGLNPATEDNLIRVNIPQMSGERRQELIKVTHEKGEEAKISIRQIRQDKIKSAEEMVKVGKVSEDEEERFKKELQKAVDNCNKLIDEIKASKEKELLES